MRKRLLQKVFLLSAFLMIPLGCFGVVNWNNGHTISPTHRGLVHDETLNIGTVGATSTITLSCDIYVQSLHQDLNINVSSSTLLKSVSGHNVYTHLSLFADSGREITVNVDYDLVFTPTEGAIIADNNDFILTFSGRGITRFKLRDYNANCDWSGVSVVFNSDGNFVNRGSMIDLAKTRVYILMDQTKEDAITNGINKVIFERETYNYSFPGTPCDPAECPDCYYGRPVRVIVAPGSYITYLSTNATGWPSDTAGSTGYGALAFDPTHAGNGRMVLEIQGDPGRWDGTACTLTHNYNDGAVIVDGHYVPSFSESDIRNNVYLNANAGIKAIFRIIDDLAIKNSSTPTTAYSYDPADTIRRGLLVICKNTTVPQSANDPYAAMKLPTGQTYDCDHPNTHNGVLPYPTYWKDDYSWYNASGNYYAQKTTTGLGTYNVRTGFTLGQNGWMDIYHKTFLDYIACGIPTLDYFANQDFSDYQTCNYDRWDPNIDAINGVWPSVFKLRNPAAFHVDGLNRYQNYNDSTASRPYMAVYTESGYTQGIEESSAYKYYGTNAQMAFYGDARAYFRACHCETAAAASTCTICEEQSGFRLGPEDPESDADCKLALAKSYRPPCYGPWFVGEEYVSTCTWEGDIVYTFTIDSQAYNGEYIPSTAITAGEGKHVIDVEGRLRVDTFARNDAPRRTITDVISNTPYTAASSTEKGVINMPTVLINHRGEETLLAGTAVTRPLTRDQSYSIYESPSMFLNDSIELYNTKYEHNDVVKAMSMDPSAALPAIVGGERLYFMNTVWSAYSNDAFYFEHFEYPKIYLYNSEVNLHESLVSSGVRWLFKEKLFNIGTWYQAATLAALGDYGIKVFSTSADNTSVLRCYDHGDDLDTLQKGYGRMFMVGCGNNLMANDSSNSVVESGFVNGYRGGKSPRYSDNLIPTETIKLSLCSAFDSGFTPRGGILPTNEDERAYHLFLLSRNENTGGGVSYMSLGWTSTVGDQANAPWLLTVGNNADQFVIAATSDSSLTGTYPIPATLSVDGNYYYFGGTDYSGNKAKIPVTIKGQGSVIYSNHGGRFSITQPLSSGVFDTAQHGYDCFVDTQIAYRLWPTENLCGMIDLPKDQVVYGDSYVTAFGRQPYDIDTSINNGDLRVRVYNTIVPTGRIAKDQKSGEEVVIPWNTRTYTQRGWDSSFIPVKNLPTRYTAIVDDAVTLPDNLLTFSTNDYVTQLKVSGATLADPLHLLITGDRHGHGFGWVKEIVSLPSDPSVLGEGDHGMIFLNNGGRIGLGTRDWNDLSEGSWNKLGKDHVTISPDFGNCRVDVNSDLIVTDPVAIVPTVNFGLNKTERITFYAKQAHKIIIPAGGELDLSSFGNTNQQQIAFGGKVKLIFEAGSTLRFPNISSGEYPVLYMNDESELIFLGEHEASKDEYASITAADANKIKIVGEGRIWLNKNAKMRVMRDAHVAVQSDTNSPTTDLIISVRRQGAIYIGDDNQAGGAFEIGNPTDTAGLINFTLALDGPRALFHIARGGFFGLGVGIVNKKSWVETSYPPNGDAVSTNNPTISGSGTLTWNPSTKAWQVKTLYDVATLSIILGSNGGIFEHKNIFDGSDSRGSLMAIGPISSYYYFEINNPYVARIHGGGNLMYLAAGSTARVNMWDYADAADRDDGDRYSILGSAKVITQKVSGDLPNSTLASTANGGQSFTSGTGIYLDLFTYLKYPVYTELNTKLVCFASTEFQNYMGYVNYSTYVTPSKNYSTPGAQIVRNTDVNIIGEGDPELGLEEGILGSSNGYDPDPLLVVGRR